MIIRKTTKEFKRNIKSFDRNFGNDTAKHWVRVISCTYWFLFIPIYTTEKITTTTLWRLGAYGKMIDFICWLLGIKLMNNKFVACPKCGKREDIEKHGTRCNCGCIFLH